MKTFFLVEDTFHRKIQSLKKLASPFYYPRVIRPTSKFLIGLTFHRSDKLDLNWNMFVGESDIMFVGVYFSQFVSNFDE